MLAILEIQALARDAILRTLELMEAWIIALTKLLLPSLKWLQCSPKLIGNLSYLQYKN